MAEKRRFLDVWIVESNTVYQEVPFEVVCDWVQQGRLLADDMVKPSGVFTAIGLYFRSCPKPGCAIVTNKVATAVMAMKRQFQTEIVIASLP